MDYLDALLSRNAEFASLGFNPNLKMMPSGRVLILGCVDPRVDPFNIFKLEPGEAAVYRNVGGRVSPATLETLALLRIVAKAAGGKIGPGSNLIVLHHTDCGINHCYRHAPELLAQHMGVALEQLDALAITDPYRSIAYDIEVRKANPRVWGGYTVTGLVYDLAAGKVNVVVPPTLLQPEGTLP